MNSSNRPAFITAPSRIAPEHVSVRQRLSGTKDSLMVLSFTLTGAIKEGGAVEHYSTN